MIRAGMGCSFLGGTDYFICVCFSITSGLTCRCLLTKSCPTLLQPMDCSLPGFSVRGILQARILEWVAMAFSRGSSRPRDRTCISCIARRVLYLAWLVTRRAQPYHIFAYFWLNTQLLIHIPKKANRKTWFDIKLFSLKNVISQCLIFIL